jgi:hypothetical protein
MDIAIGEAYRPETDQDRNDQEKDSVELIGFHQFFPLGVSAKVSTITKQEHKILVNEITVEVCFTEP